MKFYRDKNSLPYFYLQIKNNKLTAIYIDNFAVDFYKNGLRHNTKNAAYINNCGYKEFELNNKFYGFAEDFTKELWRRFVKMQVFL